MICLRYSIIFTLFYLSVPFDLVYILSTFLLYHHIGIMRVNENVELVDLQLTNSFKFVHANSFCDGSDTTKRVLF